MPDDAVRLRVSARCSIAYDITSGNYVVISAVGDHVVASDAYVLYEEAAAVAAQYRERLVDRVTKTAPPGTRIFSVDDALTGAQELLNDYEIVEVDEAYIVSHFNVGGARPEGTFRFFISKRYKYCYTAVVTESKLDAYGVLMLLGCGMTNGKIVTEVLPPPKIVMSAEAAVTEAKMWLVSLVSLLIEHEHADPA